jgi:GSCFA family
VRLKGNEALRNATANEDSGFPSRDNFRCRDGHLFPALKPRFKIGRGCKIFTLGSCFARNIEAVLEGFDLPTLKFGIPEAEFSFPSRPNGILNEFNPGTMAQRIEHAVHGREFPEETILQTTDGFLDLMLFYGSPVSYERIIERRREVSEVYSHLPTADVIIITLGLVEAWFDRNTGLYINQVPPLNRLRGDSQFELHRLSAAESFALLDRAFGIMSEGGVKRVILTLSPVPLQTTFTTEDCVTANSYSKATLRVCADMLCERYSFVDYFPSYEIVMSGGLNSFAEDNVHVRWGLVKQVTDYMMAHYIGDAAQSVHEKSIGVT